MLIPSILFCALIPGRVMAAVEKEIVRRDEYFVRDFGKNVLKHLPEGALLFSDRADELEFSLAYLLYAERERADVRFIDCNAGVSRSIYGTDYYRIWGKPRLRIREQVEKKLIEQRDKPVLYGTMDTKQINIPMVSHGFLYNVPGTHGLAKPVLWDCFLIRERGSAVQDIRITHLHQNKLSLLAQYFLDNKLDHSAERAIEMLKAYGGNKQWGMIAAYWYYERSMFLKAEQEYQHLLSPGDDPVVLLYLGVLYNKWGKFSRAEQILKKAVSLDPSESQAYYNLAVTYWHFRRWKDAADAFARTLALEPENTEAQKFYRLAEERRRRQK